MRILEFTHTILMVSGCFRPQSWTSLFKRTVYNIYRLYIIAMLYTFTILQIMDIILYVDNPDDFTNNVNMMLTILASCYKMFIMCLNYENMVMLINYLTEEPFKPLDLGEMKIRRQYDKIIRNNTLRYVILVGTTCTFVILSSFFTDFRYKRLKYREWIPFDYSSYVIFCFAYAQQMLSACHSAVVNVAIDSLMCGFLMHICCQIEILEYRLKKTLGNQLTLGYCVRHHNRIFKLVIILMPENYISFSITTMCELFSKTVMEVRYFHFLLSLIKEKDKKFYAVPSEWLRIALFAQIVNIKFTKIIGFQFIASMMTFCSNLYQMTKSSLNADHFPLIIYTSCMLTQIFIYCWFGNKVKLKSLQLTDSIFQMEWPIMNSSMKKSLLIIMKRAMIPIEISTVYILTINLDSFVLLLKTSYSVYNLLIQVQ